MTNPLSVRIKETAEFNNIGVAHLKEGKLEEAKKSFARGLEGCHRILSIAQQNLEQEVVDDDCVMRDSNSPQEEEDDSLFLDRLMNVNSRYGNRLGFYREPIAFPTNHCELPNNTGARHTMDVLAVSKHLSVIIMFNQAMTHQQMGYRNRNNADLLMIAIRLYKCSISLILEEDDVFRPMAAMNFIMACYNNMGLLYQELNLAQKSDLCFRKLLHTLMFWIDSRQDCEDVSCDNFQLYFETISHLILPNKPPAAAA